MSIEDKKEQNELTIMDKINNSISLITNDAIKVAYHNFEDAIKYKLKGKIRVSKTKINLVVDFLKDAGNTFIAKTKEEENQINALAEFLKELNEKSKLPRY